MRRWCLAALAAASVLGCAHHDSPDLAAYIEQIRAQGMSEGGKSELRTIASALVGNSTFECREDGDSGRFWKSYRSNTCTLPGSDAEQVARLRLRLAAQEDSLINLLQPLADGDSSGFVSTGEGTALRNLFELAVMAAAVEKKYGPSPEALSRACGLAPEEITAQLAAYRAFAGPAREMGLEGLPVVEVR